MTDLEKQIEKERLEIENAPRTPVRALSGTHGRCSWCGQLSQNLILVDVVHGTERFKGAECCG